MKVSFGDTTLAFNPISKKSKLKQSKFGSDVALISQKHVDSNGSEQVALGDREPFIINGPGEYEIKGVTVTGFQTETLHGGQEAINTVYIVKLEGMRMCFLGTLSTKETKDLPSALLEMVDGVDILFVPVGGDGMLEASDAHKMSVKIGAHVVIPIGYDDKSLKTYLKEEGAESLKAVDKLTLKKKDVETKEGEVVVLKA